jgi:hypothetical protein
MSTELLVERIFVAVCALIGCVAQMLFILSALRRNTTPEGRLLLLFLCLVAGFVQTVVDHERRSGWIVTLGAWWVVLAPFAAFLGKTVLFTGIPILTLVLAVRGWRHYCRLFAALPPPHATTEFAWVRATVGSGVFVNTTKTAQDRARELLLSRLDPDQRRCFERHGYFFVRVDLQGTVDSVTGASHRLYKITNGGRSGNIREVDPFTLVEITSYCIHPQDFDLPQYDVMLAQKLSLEHDHAGFLKTANMQQQRIAAVLAPQASSPLPPGFMNEVQARPRAGTHRARPHNEVRTVMLDLQPDPGNIAVRLRVRNLQSRYGIDIRAEPMVDAEEAAPAPQPVPQPSQRNRYPIELTAVQGVRLGDITWRRGGTGRRGFELSEQEIVQLGLPRSTELMPRRYWVTTDRRVEYLSVFG